MGYSVNAIGGESPLPGIEILSLDAELSVAEFEAVVSTLAIPEHFDMAGDRIEPRPAIQMDDTIKAGRTPNKPRDPWAPDHYWHSDRTYWGDNQFASVLYARRMVGSVAATGFIDTTLLLQAMEADDPGLTSELAESEATFSVGRYFEEILPVDGSKAAITETMTSRGVRTLTEVARLEIAKYPEKTFPTIPIHPFRGEPCTMIDNSRVIALSGIAAARSKEIITRAKNRYLDLPLEELLQRPYHYLHQWEEGQAVIYPQVGTLHRAMPSPAGEQQRDTLRLFIV